MSIKRLPNEDGYEVCGVKVDGLAHALAGGALGVGAGRQPGDPLRSIEEHNVERKRKWDAQFKPQPTGFACPKCGKEVYRPASRLHQQQSNAWALLDGGPPREEVTCGDLACGWKGWLYS